MYHKIEFGGVFKGTGQLLEYFLYKAFYLSETSG